MIFRDIDGSARSLAERPDAERQAVVGPGFLLDGKDLSELGSRGLQPGFQAPRRFRLSEAMGNGNDQGRGHRGAPRRMIRASSKQNGTARPTDGSREARPHTAGGDMPALNRRAGFLSAPVATRASP